MKCLKRKRIPHFFKVPPHEMLINSEGEEAGHHRDGATGRSTFSNGTKLEAQTSGHQFWAKAAGSEVPWEQGEGLRAALPQQLGQGSLQPKVPQGRLSFWHHCHG